MPLLDAMSETVGGANWHCRQWLCPRCCDRLFWQPDCGRIHWRNLVRSNYSRRQRRFPHAVWHKWTNQDQPDNGSFNSGPLPMITYMESPLTWWTQWMTFSQLDTPAATSKGTPTVVTRTSFWPRSGLKFPTFFADWSNTQKANSFKPLMQWIHQIAIVKKYDFAWKQS